MASRHEDIAGQKFGRVTALFYQEQSKSGGAIWHCRCDCGVEFDTYAVHLKMGLTQSCGCLRRERIAETSRKRIKLSVADIKRLDGMLQGAHKGVQGAFTARLLTEDQYEEILQGFIESRHENHR